MDFLSEQLAEYLGVLHENGELGATPSATTPTTWFSLAKALQAKSTKKDLKLPDASGNQVIALGTPRTVGGKSLLPGDQFFFEPVTKKLLATKTLRQLQAESARSAPAAVTVPAASKYGPPPPLPVASKYGPPPPLPVAPTPAPGPGGIVEKTGALTQIARAFGIDIPVATPYGPDLRDVWLYLGRVFRVSGTTHPVVGDVWKVYVDPGALASLRVRARSAKPTPMTLADVRRKLAGTPTKPSMSPAGQKPTSTALARVNIGQAQEVLVTLGAKIASDGLFGPKTASAWKTAAQKRKLNPVFNRAAPNEAFVDPATFRALTAAAAAVRTGVAPKPPTPSTKTKAKPTDPSRSGLTKINVGQAQDVLIRLGVAIKRDGDFGPKTAAAWKQAAVRRKLDGVFDRAGPIEAWVDPKTFTELSGQAGDKKAEPKGVPISAKDEKKPEPGGAKPATKLEPISQNELGVVLRGFRVQPRNEKELQDAWAALAKARKLNGTSQVSKQYGLEVVPQTKTALIKEGALRLSVQEIVALSTASVTALEVKQALRFANQVDAYKGQFPKVSSGHEWDAATETMFLRFANIPAKALPVWERAFKNHLVSKDKKTLKLPEQYASAVKAAAGNFKTVKKAVEKKEADAKKVQEVEKKVDDYLASRVAAATVQVPVSTLQQALSEVRERQKEGVIPGPMLPGIKLTGRWDENTSKALYETFSDKLWGRPNIPAGKWKALTNRLLSVKKSSKALNGLYGVFGDLAETPKGANYIRLTPEVAQTVQSLSKNFLARGKKGPLRESDEEPLPKKKKTVAITDPAYVTGRVDKPDAFLTQPVFPSQQPIQQPVQPSVIQPSVIQTDEGPVDIPAGPAPIVPLPEPQPMPAPPPIPGPMPFEPSPEPEQPSAPPPAPEPSAPEPPPAKGGGNWGLALLAAAGAAFLLFKGEKEHRAEKGRSSSMVP
jgi:hypothetical protein